MAMTLGTFVLVLLESKAEPLPSPLDRLIAVPSPSIDIGQITQTDVPLQLVKWRNLVVHSSASAGSELAKGCHFLVVPGADGRGGSVVATDRWKQQADGRHVQVAGFDYNRNSIGVCVIGEFSSRPPSRDQFDAVVGLVRQLRRQCGVPADQVYLARQLPLAQRTPGEAFPMDLFEQLVKAPVR